MQQYNKIGTAGHEKSGHQNGIRFQWTFQQGTKKGSHLDSLSYSIVSGLLNCLSTQHL